MGVWIEIRNMGVRFVPWYVTPCMGVWIEISNPRPSFLFGLSHSLYGSVD